MEDIDNLFSPRERGGEIVKILGEKSGRQIWCFAGGKGGTGKTALTANVGVTLAAMGWKVMLLDADFGGANLHTILHIPRPKYTLCNFIAGKNEKLTDIILGTPSENLRLISGGTEITGIANLSQQAKSRLKSQLDSIEADYLLIDLGAGMSYNVLDFFLLCDEGFIVTNPEPTAKLNAYTFLKNLVYRSFELEFRNNEKIREIIINHGTTDIEGTLPVPELLSQIEPVDSEALQRIEKILEEFSFKLVMNKVRKRPGYRDAAQVTDLAKRYLGLSVSSAGTVREDSRVIDSSEEMMPVVLRYPGCKASMDIYTLVMNLGIEDRLARFSPGNTGMLKRIIKEERRYWIK